MISSGELRKGITIELDGELYQVLDYQHIKMGRGSAQVRLKLRDIQGGHTIERTFQASEKFTRARLDYRKMQYLYNEGDLYYCMDEENFEQIPLTTLQVIDTGPGFKGDTATAGTKPAKLETGITIQVPLFVNNGDVIKVNTRTGSYLERAG